MGLPAPVPGLVIRYSYLWLEEHRKGREEGVKDRPCAIVLASAETNEGQTVLVLPITHSPPRNPNNAVEIPSGTKMRLELDEARSWIVLTEANRFVWPGPDLRPAIARKPESVAYGQLPYALFEQVRLGFIKAIKEHRAQAVARTI